MIAMKYFEPEQIDECTYKMPDGAYWDGEEVLRAKDGTPMPDGCYMTSEGELVMYEGNFPGILTE